MYCNCYTHKELVKIVSLGQSSKSKYFSKWNPETNWRRTGMMFVNKFDCGFLRTKITSMPISLDPQQYNTSVRRVITMARLTFPRMSKFYKRFLCLIIIYFLIKQMLNKNKTKLKIKRYLSDLKYILIWTKLQDFEGDGQKYFIQNKCKHINCYFTKNRDLLGDTRFFDAIVFSAQDLHEDINDLPKVRSNEQKFIFASNDSADNYPVCDPVYDDFFNWTWTYRIESTVSYTFIAAYNTEDQELGTHFHWRLDMKPLSLFQISKLIGKYKVAAIFMNKCKTVSRREKFVEKLDNALQAYNFTVDIFGKCGRSDCKKDGTMRRCFRKLRKEYYFYLAFEDSVSEGFVSDEVLIAYQNNVVPVVFGKGNYEKYLPPGSYINAMEYTPDTLAREIYAATRDREMYSDYFRWKNHYVMKRSRVLDACKLCEAMNKKIYLQTHVSYKLFRSWWHPMFAKRCQDEEFPVMYS